MLAAGAADDLVLLDAEQHMRGLAPVRDEHRSVLGRLLGLARVLIELPAGERRHRHGLPHGLHCSNVSTNLPHRAARACWVAKDRSRIARRRGSAEEARGRVADEGTLTFRVPL